ncbi:MAG TPA: hypothetical protein VFW13_12930 [Phenylobacterium sp.]|nr:hypothetical protein [Phenylobacterium sp.]
MSASAQCPHGSIEFNLNVVGFGDTNIRYLEIRGRCKGCDATIRFQGPHGLSPEQPTVSSVLGDEASLPFMFGDEEYDRKAVGVALRMQGAS